MTRRRLMIVLAVLALGGAGTVVAVASLRQPEPQAAAIECDSCSARKQHIKRLRQAQAPDAASNTAVSE